MGVYDKSKFARLDRVCEECYQMFRDPDIHSMCRYVSTISSNNDGHCDEHFPSFHHRRNCFVNEIFDKCTEALMLSNEEPKLKSYVNLLSTGQ
jgi:hypothetical protein